MDKTDINNFIVSMRSCITQARVQICNKLVQEKRKLLNNKGSEEQRKRNSQKAERLLKEILLMKKLDKDEITKYVLLCTGNPQEKFHKGTLQLDERVKLRFAIHKNVSKKVEEFRAKYPDWALKLPPIIVQLGMRYKIQKKSSKRTGKNRNNEKNNEKTHNIINSKEKYLSETSKTMGLVEEKGFLEDKAITQKQSMVKKGSASIAEVQKFADMELENSVKKDISDNQNISLKTKASGYLSEVGRVTDIEKLESKKGTENAHNETKARGRIAEVRKFTEILELQNNDTQDNAEFSDDSLSSSSENVSSHINSDPFFLNGSESELSENENDKDRERQCGIPKHFTIMNESFKTNRQNDYVKSKNLNNRHITKHPPNTGTLPTMNRKQKRLLERLKAEKGVPVLKNEDISKLLASSKSSRNKGFPEINKFKHVQGFKDECLHPSWEAKRKQREIVPFQGKKIKFECD